MKSSNYLFYTAILGIALSAPLTSHAAVVITEIMYDLPGSDTDREWVEITNQGSATVDVSGYKFFEYGTNHGLTLATGATVLAPEQSAVIANNAATFKIDWPNYSGTLFDSSFSLSNTGEPLALKNSAGDIEDSVSYTSDFGAAGDGNSLHRSGNSFVARAPNPGVFGSQSGSTPSSGGPSSSPSSYSTSTSTPTSTPAQNSTITARAGGDQTVFVGAGSVFEGEALGTQGSLLQNARYVWNFGDGAVAEGKSVMHTYLYPGTYIAVLSIASGEYSASDRLTVTVLLPEVALVVEADGSLVVRNASSREIDLGAWSLVRGGAIFTIPRRTFVPPGGSTRFAPGVLGFSGDVAAVLFFPNGTIAAQANQQSPAAAAVPPPAGDMTKRPLPATHPTKTPPITPTVSEDVTGEDLAAAPASGNFSLPLWGYLAGLIALVGLGVVGSLYARLPTEPTGKTKSTADEFEITD